MEQIILSNPQQADEALNAAHAMCEGDPLLANERGVMAFNHGRCVFHPWYLRNSRIYICAVLVQLRPSIGFVSRSHQPCTGDANV